MRKFFRLVVEHRARPAARVVQPEQEAEVAALPPQVLEVDDRRVYPYTRADLVDCICARLSTI
jgi:hypothetical protein